MNVSIHFENDCIEKLHTNEKLSLKRRNLVLFNIYIKKKRHRKVIWFNPPYSANVPVNH